MGASPPIAHNAAEARFFTLPAGGVYAGGLKRGGRLFLVAVVVRFAGVARLRVSLSRACFRLRSCRATPRQAAEAGFVLVAPAVLHALRPVSPFWPAWA